MKTAIIAIALLGIFFSPAAYAQFEELGLKGKHYDGRFLVYAPDYELAGRVADRVRYIFQKVVDDIGYATSAYTTRYQLLVWYKQEDFLKVLNNLNIQIHEGGVAVAVDAFEGLPTILGYFDEHFLDNSLPHEMTHLILREILRVPSSNIPLWLNEGLAMYEGATPLTYVHLSLKEALAKNDYIPLSELLALKTYPSGSERIKLFYLEAQSFVSFLIHKRKRKDNLFSFMRWHIDKGYPFEKAYLYAYAEAPTIDKLEKEWIEYINANLR